MKHLLLYPALLLGTFPAIAETWDLDRCISYAVENNITIKSRQNDVASSQQNVTDAKSRYLPTLSANAGQSWNIGRGLTAENTYADRNTSNFQWGASFNLPIFSGPVSYTHLDVYKRQTRFIRRGGKHPRIG